MVKNHNDLRETHIIGIETREKIVSPRELPALQHQGIHLLGCSLARKGFCFARTNPQHGQLLVCVSGRGKVWVNNQWEICSACTAYVTPAGIPHAYEALGNEEWEVCWIIYRARHQALRDYQEPTLISAEPAGFYLSIQGLYQEVLGDGDASALRLWMQLVKIESGKILRADSMDARLHQLFQLVDRQLAFPWNTETLAKKIYLSPEHLRRLCHQYYQCSPMRQVTNLRMRHAASLLSFDSCKIEDIARQVGYANAFAFATAFKRIMGMPPSTYRERTI
jgi:AraC-like DNA-binding protein